MSCSHTSLKNKVGQSLKVALTSVCLLDHRYTCTQRHIIDILTYTHHDPQPKGSEGLEMGRPFQYCWLWGLKHAMQPSQDTAFPGESLHTNHS